MENLEQLSFFPSKMCFVYCLKDFKSFSILIFDLHKSQTITLGITLLDKVSNAILLKKYQENHLMITRFKAPQNLFKHKFLFLSIILVYIHFSYITMVKGGQTQSAIESAQRKRGERSGRKN